MKKIIQILVLSLLYSVLAISQNIETTDNTSRSLTHNKFRDERKLFQDKFLCANTSPTELIQHKAISDISLLMDRTYEYQWNKKESYWINTTNYLYYYDANYKLDEKLEKEPDGSGPKQKTLYYYDGNNGLRVEERIYDYDAESSEWSLAKKIFYLNTNDTLREKLTQNFNGSEFEDFSKHTYVYNANHNLDYYIVQYKVYDNWINSAKWIYFHDQSNNLYEMHNRKWDSELGQFTAFSKNFYQRDENGNLLMSESVYWNDKDLIWEKTLRQDYYYNDDGYMTYFKAKRLSDDIWVNVFKQVYTYLPAGSKEIMVQNSGINKSIDDHQTTEDIIVINNEKSALNMSLVGIEVLIDSVMHTSVGDLEFSLSHNGITKTIIYQAGGDGDNFINTTLSDRGIDSIAIENAPFLGIYKPENPLSSFLGTDPSGSWTLSIYDGVADNSGELKSWGLNLIYSPVGTFIDRPKKEIPYTIFPNPASSVIRLQSTVNSIQLAVVEIFDLTGKKLFNTQIPMGTNDFEIDVNHLKNGVYFCRMIQDNQSVTKKLIINK